MKTKPKSIFFLFTSLLLIVYGISLLVNQVFEFNKKWVDTSNTFNQMFMFFSVSSFILLVIHYLVYKKNKEQLGFVFLVTLTIKVAASFLFITEIVNVFEKYYTFSYFFVFLLIDVFITVRLLNKKD